MFLPTVFLDLISKPLEFLAIIEIILPALISLAFVEIVSMSHKEKMTLHDKVSCTRVVLM